MKNKKHIYTLGTAISILVLLLFLTVVFVGKWVFIGILVKFGINLF